MQDVKDQETDEFLAHFGVKGMKWGVRRAASTVSGAAGSAATKQATRMTQQSIRLHEAARDNKGVIGKLALADKYTWGRGGKFEKYHNQSIEQLKNSQAAIDRGSKKVTALTVVGGSRYTSTNKGKTRSRSTPRVNFKD